MVAMSLPLGYFLVFELNLGLVGVWLAITVDEWTRAIIMYFRWKRENGKDTLLCRRKRIVSDVNTNTNNSKKPANQANPIGRVAGF